MPLARRIVIIIVVCPDKFTDSYEGGLKIVNLILLLIFTFFAGCNFESGSEDDSGGGLFSGHKEVTNSLFISVPANQTYVQNQNLDFSISHPYDLTVSGNPRIQIDLDGNTVYANYLKGSGSKKIIFRYTIQAGDEDTNGIEVASSIDLNGGTLQFSNAGVITNSTTDFISPPSTDNILVDTTGPSIILVTPPAPKIYYKGDVLDFIVIFDDSTLVSGSPRIQLDIGGVTRYATYSGGNATTTHIYKYHVQESDLDLDGISMSSPLGLNNGSLKDSAGNNATLTFVPLPMITTYVDGNSPYVTGFTLPTDKTYILGDIISVDVKFNESVIVASGTPTLPLVIGSSTENATYLSGSGTDTLTFQYIVSNGDEDTDGLRVSTPLSLNGATIQDSESNDARLDLAAPLTPNVIVDGSVPEIIAMTVPTDANYTDGQTLDFTIQFDEEVIVTNTPRLPITLDTGTIYAEYVSGTNSDTLTFQYTVLNSDQDDDGISFSTTSLDLNSTATIVSAKYNTVNALLDFTSNVPADTSNIKVNENPAVAVVITTQPTNTNNGFTISPALTVEVRDGSNNLIMDATEAVTLAFGTDPSAGTATLSGTLTVNAVNGIATFSDLSIDTVNSGYTLTASSGSLTPDTSNSFDITQAPATQVVFNQEPTNNIAGVNFSPSLTVEFQDANGNIVPTETSNITIAFGTDPSTGAATLGGTLTIAAVAGTATFTDINIDKAFTGYTLTASSGVLASDTTASFDISPNAKSKLTFITQPVDTDYNSIINPAVTVEIQDAYGNITTDTDNINLTINSNPGGSTLSGTTTQAAVNGTATFDDISLDQIGTSYTLDATSGALTLDTSSAFDIVATPTQLVITQEPSDTYNGFLISPAITVEIRDAQNNVVTSATDNVTVSINNNPSAGTLGGTLTVAAVAGIATFSDLEIDNTGVGYTLDFNSGALTSATSTSFDITQAPATQVAFIQNPSNAVAGVANSPDITVELQDANGNIVPTESSNVTLAFGTDPSAGAATLGGTLTVAASSGLATFNDITIDKAFTGYTLTASSGALTTDTSSTFDISPAAKAKLAFNVQPVNTEYNSSIAPSITVEIQDAFGNVTTDTDNITLAINNNPGGSTLSGTTTQAAVAGTATFNDISLDQVGSSYTLDATSGALTPDTSSAFDIVATPTQLVITQEPSNTGESLNISPVITVEIRDAQNNLVTSATNNISVSINNDPSAGSATLGGTTTVAAVAGIATFSNLNIDSSFDGYTLIFSSGSLTNVISSSFNVFTYANLSYADSSTYDFGQISLGSSAEVSIMINYSGSVVANSVSSSNPSSEIQYKGGSFPGTGGTCGSSISSNCLIVITYTPSTATTNTETLTISYNDGSSAQSINKTITGEGINTTPTKISVIGSTGFITGDCIPFTIQSQTATGQSANVSSDENISLLVNNGTGSFYSDSSCTTTTTSTSIQSGSSSKIIYFETSTSGQDLTLIFNATTLDNTSKLVTSSSAPTEIYASISNEIITSNCSMIEVSLIDPSGIKTGASTSQLIDITHSSDAVFYSDSFCTGVITDINFDAYEATKYIYTKNETTETVTITFSDNSALLTQDMINTDFVSSLTWWDTNWLKRKKIILNNIDQATTFTDMPILVKLNSTRINYDDFNGTGSDIRFTLNDHTTELDYSIEQWDSSGDSFIWVRVPTVSASSEIEIYMYYENTSALDASNGSNVFSNYEGVWNMDKSGSDYIDSTGSGKDGTTVGTITDFSGPIGNATSFDGASEIDTSYGLEQILGRTSTMSLWIKTTQVGNDTNWQAPGITGVEESGGGNDIFFGFIRSDGSIAVNSGNSGVAASNFIINDDNWRYVTIQRDETTGDIRFFVNGVLNGSGTSDTGYKSTTFQSFGVIADTGGSPNYFEGEMDGIRISNSYLDTETIKADFKFQADTHITYGQEEDL